MTIANGSLIEAADLNTEQDQQRAAITAALQTGLAQTWVWTATALNLVTTTAMHLRSRRLVPTDDFEILGIGLTWRGAGAVGSITARLETPDDAENTFLLGEALTHTAQTAVGGKGIARLDLTSLTGTRRWLVKGVPFRLSVEQASATATAYAAAHLLLRSRVRER